MPVARRDDAPLGVVYTPGDVARAMVELALARFDGLSADALLALRICDPALGEGAFLVEVVNVLAARVVAAWQREGHRASLADAKREIAASCIHGVDIDARAVAAARATLHSENLVVGDALELDWSKHPRFDLVIGNPPYVRQEHLAGKSALRELACYDGVADLYVYFIELAHRIARYYCFITPNKWLTVAYARPLREFLATRRSVEGVIDLGRAQLFAGADAFPSIVWGSSEAVAQPIRAARISSIAELATAGEPHDRARWTAEPWHIDAPADRAVIDRLERRWPPLGDLVGRPARGIVTGYNKAFVIDRATRDRLARDPAAEPLIRPLLKGRDIRRWRPEYADRYIVLIDHGTPVPASIDAHLSQFREDLEPKRERGEARGRKPGSYRWCELQDPVGELSASRASRIFYQDIQSAAAFCLDETGLVPDTTVWTLPSSDRYLLAVLNSPLYWWYAQRRFPPALNGSVRPKHDYIRSFPIATPSPPARAAIEALVDRRFAGEAVDPDIARAVLALYELDERELDLEPGGCAPQLAAGAGHDERAERE